MTVTKILAEIARKTGMSTTEGTDDLAQIEHAITEAGQVAAEWTDWWWLRGSGDFDTVADTASYALQTELSDTTLWAITRLYYDDDHWLRPISWARYKDLLRLTDTTSTPTMFVVTEDPPKAYLYPTPSAAETLYVDYVKQHSDIEDDSDDGLLLVPARFHYRVYVNGAVFLLNNGVGDPSALKSNPQFIATMHDMAKMDPESYGSDHEEDLHPGSESGTWPSDKRVWRDPFGQLIIDHPSLT